ncbi:Alanine--tRNA ligase [uncultured archaeon]|nr:Alanine--tRNA ligase [uncultured archaeon]
MLKATNGTLKKDYLKAEFAKEHNKYYSSKLFEDKGFKRHTYKYCGMNFWSIADTDNCGDSSHNTFTFFKDRPTRISYSDFWKKFARFFKENGHALVDRYPVVSRWRPDLYFTIAGIQDFQRIENGLMTFEYSANPLMVPQMCLRFNDIENVGVTGSHFTSFMMANQTSFNYPKEGYWRDRTVELNFNFFTKMLGLPEDQMIYHEDVWAMGDFSEFGPCLENFAGGAELCNSVFTQFELANGKVRELESKVVDVGWGFERLLWFYTGHSNAYEAAFGETLSKIKKDIHVEFDPALYRKFAAFGGKLNRDEISNFAEVEEQILRSTGISKKDYETKIKPMQAVYATVDHARTLLFAIKDGSLPSNVGGGYNLRIILRRSLDFIDAYKLDYDMPRLARLVAHELKDIYPELSDGLETFDRVIEVEKDRHRKAHENAKRVVEGILAKGNTIGKDQLRTLYESNGVTPELIARVARERGAEVELPENAYADIVKDNQAVKEKAKKLDVTLPEGIRETRKLYYDFVSKADAKVVFAKGRFFALDQTPFYPESGGQASDRGTVGGLRLIDVQKLGNVIVHVAEKDAQFKAGEKVECVVDVERRKAIIAHHTATHLISAACRKLLGEHAWQEGAKKEHDRAHIDIAHYDKLGDDQALAIENQVNAWLFDGIKVSAGDMDRSDAEAKYGFSIYQGKGVPAKTMRIVVIKTLGGELIDAEACGGLHAAGKENFVGFVKITGTSRIHDGVDRIDFVAGPAALRRFQQEHSELEKMSRSLNSEPLLVGGRLDELIAENGAMHKEIEKGKDLLAVSIAESLPDDRFIEKELEVDRKMMVRIADLLVKRNGDCNVLLRNRDGDVVCMSGAASQTSAIDRLNERLKHMGMEFKGGGSRKIAQGRITRK